MRRSVWDRALERMHKNAEHDEAALREAEAEAANWQRQCQLAERQRDAALQTAREFEHANTTNTATLTSAIATVANLTAAVERERDRYEVLLGKFTTLRVAGAVPEAPPIVPPPPPDTLEQAVDLATRGMPYEVQMAARQQLARDRVAIDAGFSTEKEVLDLIVNGIRADGVPG